MAILKTTYTVLSAVVLVIILGLVVICVRYNRAFRNTSEMVQHTVSVLDETRNVGAGLRDLEKGLGQGNLYAHIQSLRIQTEDNPIQQRRVDSLQAFAASIHSDTSVIRPLPGRAVPYYPDSIRETLLRIMSAEQTLLGQRETANQKTHEFLSNSIIGLLILTFTLLCASASLIIFHFRGQQRAEKQLDASERRFSQLVQREKFHGIFMLDPDGRVMTWNEGARRIKGYGEQEVIGQPMSIFYTKEDVEAGEPARNLEKAAASGEYESLGWRKRKDGSLFWADVMFTALHDGKGHLTGFIKVTRDISDQRIAEEEIKNSLTREKELNEMKSRFVSLASHEFKTPLSVILSSVSLIEKYQGADMADKRSRHIQRIKSNVNNLKQILDDFLSLEKLESGIVINNPGCTDIVRMIAETIADLEPTCKEDQSIRVQTSGNRRPVMADPHLLRHVLNNLLTNAIKYSPPHTSILVDIAFDGDAVHLHVIDTGIGIPVEEQPHLFERFFRAANTTGISGTGLGLSIVKKYLDLMNGSISVKSCPGEGSTFTVILPMAMDAS